MTQTLNYDCLNNVIVAGPTPTCTRASTKQVRGLSGALELVAADTISQEYDFKNKPLGWLIEDERTNLFNASRYFPSSSRWSKESGVTGDYSVGQALDGSQDQDRFNVTANWAYRFAGQTHTLTGDAVYSQSAFFEDDGAGYMGLSRTVGDGSEHHAIMADLKTGDIVWTSLGPSSVASDFVGYGAEPFINNNYRLWIAGQIDEAVSLFPVRALLLPRCNSLTLREDQINILP